MAEISKENVGIIIGDISEVLSYLDSIKVESKSVLINELAVVSEDKLIQLQRFLRKVV